jgi:hypothetical protein
MENLIPKISVYRETRAQGPIDYALIAGFVAAVARAVIHPAPRR